MAPPRRGQVRCTHQAIADRASTEVSVLSRAAPTLCAMLLACALATPARGAATVPVRPGEPPLPPDLLALTKNMEGLSVSSERFRARTALAATGAHLPRELQAFLKVFDVDLSGEATLSPPAGSFALTLLGHTLRLRVAHGHTYLYEPAIARRDGHRPWIDAGRGGLGTAPVSFGAPGSSASAFKSLASALDGARNATELGAGVVDGVAVTGFKATVAVSALEGPEAPSKPHGILGGILGGVAAAPPMRGAPTSAQVEAFIAPNGQPVRTHISESSEGTSFSTLLDVFAINFPLVIQPPPARETIALAALRTLTQRRHGHAGSERRED